MRQARAASFSRRAAPRLKELTAPGRDLVHPKTRVWGFNRLDEGHDRKLAW
jgi:hypothetical protein